MPMQKDNPILRLSLSLKEWEGELFRLLRKCFAERDLACTSEGKRLTKSVNNISFKNSPPTF
jgi:hypothetical protein